MLGIEFIGEGSGARGDGFSVRYHFGDPSGAVTATARRAPPDGYFMRIEEDDGPGSYDALANSRVLVITGGKGEWTYDLTGSNPAMKSLVDCAQKQLDAGKGAAPPPRKSASAQPQPPQPRERDVAVAPPPAPAATSGSPAAAPPLPPPAGSRRGARTAACPAPGSVHSSQSGEASTTVFINRSNVVQNVYWLDFSGQRKLYIALQPGDRHRQKTFAGHAWLVVAADGTCQAVHRAVPGRHRQVIR